MPTKRILLVRALIAPWMIPVLWLLELPLMTMATGWRNAVESAREDTAYIWRGLDIDPGLKALHKTMIDRRLVEIENRAMRQLNGMTVNRDTMARDTLALVHAIRSLPSETIGGWRNRQRSPLESLLERKP